MSLQVAPAIPVAVRADRLNPFFPAYLLLLLEVACQYHLISQLGRHLAVAEWHGLKDFVVKKGH